MRRSLFRTRATRLRKASDRASLWMPDVAAAMVPLAGRQQPILKRTTNDLADNMLLALEAKPGIGRLTRRRTDRRRTAAFGLRQTRQAGHDLGSATRTGQWSRRRLS